MIILSMMESSPDSYECISFRCKNRNKKNDQQLPGRKDEIQMLTMPRSVRPIVMR